MAKLVKIKMLQSYTGSVDGNSEPRIGDVIEVHEVTAKDLCDRPDPRATYVKAKKKAAKRTKPKRETATKGPDETAAEE